MLFRSQQVGEILERDAQLADVGHIVVERDVALLGGGLDRRQRWHVPDHRQGAVFGVQREGHFPIHRHPVDRRQLRRLDPRVRHTVPPRSEEHTSELPSLMRISYAVFCLKKKKQHYHTLLVTDLSTFTYRLSMHT